MRTPVLLASVAGFAGSVSAQPATQFRFANGSNEITVPPGSAVPLVIYAVGLPNMGSLIPWTTPPGTGQVSHYAGFASVFMDVNGTGGAWSDIAIPPGMGYMGPPFGSAGTASGPSVTDINITVGFNATIAGNQVLLWQGTITVGATDVSLSTLIRPVFGNLGFEVQLSSPVPGLNVSQYLSATDGTAVIHVPAPAGLFVLAVAGLAAARRRR